MKKFLLFIPLCMIFFKTFAVTSYYGFRFSPTTSSDTLTLTYQICLQASVDGHSCINYASPQSVRLDQQNQGTLISFQSAVPVMAPEIKFNSIVIRSGSKQYTAYPGVYIRSANPTDQENNISVGFKSYSLVALDGKTYLTFTSTSLYVPNTQVKNLD